VFGFENIHVNKISARKRVSCSALPPAVSENMALDSSTIYMKTGFLDGKEKLELLRKLIFRVQTVREVNPPYSTVRVNLDAECLDVICACGGVRFKISREMGQGKV